MRDAVYLDSNATAPLKPKAAAAMAASFAVTGNASSVHAFGRKARRLIEAAREQVAALVGARPAQVVFTSGGTEANNVVLRGAGRRLCVSAIEHDSVLRPAAGAALIRVDARGVVDLAHLEELLRADPAPALVAAMLANNETGAIQPLAEVARIAHAHGALVHCDAVQAAGKIAVDRAALGVDTMALSAHKLGGPQGVGALILADHVALTPLLAGGGQERGRRAGTENLPGIAGFGAAAALALRDLPAMAGLAALRDGLERRLRAAAPDLVVLGEGAPRLPNTSCLALPGTKAETLVMALDLAGFAVSAGSACSSGKVTPSHVVTAMGAGPVLAAAAIRVSLGWHSTQAELDRFAAAWAAACARLGARVVPSAA